MKTTMSFSTNGKKGNMSLTAFFMGIFILISAFTFAQKTNYAGAWTLNESKSQLGEGRFRMAASKLNITQDENAITLERTAKGPNGEDFSSKEKITLDGKESVNTLMQNRTKKSVATWSADGKVLTINGTSVFERDGNTMEIKSVENYKISDDGNVLTIDVTSTSPRGERKQTLVYEKGK
jgi:hypothetical protein